MRRSFRGILVLMVMCAFALPISPVTSQEEPSTSRGGSSPQIGDLVSYIGESGSEIATLEVLQVVRPWEEYDDFYDPRTGTEYIAFEIEVTHLGRRGDLVLRGYDFRLQDADGFIISQAWTSASDTAELVPIDDDVAIAPGDTERVVVVFQIIEDIELANLFWAPDYDRLITLADLEGI